jgi:hypothetical protein
MDEILCINKLTKEEFEALVINIFYYLDYCIDISNNIKFEYSLEKEELQIILKIAFRNNGEFNTLEEILEFKKEVLNTKSWKGYFFSNTDFEKSVYDQPEIFKDQVRLFNHIESLRLGLKSI